MRLPLATDLKTSISDTTKDARLINAHTETRGGVTRVKKRPGALATGWDFTTPIQSGFGGSLLYLIYGDEFSVIDVSSPPPASVAIGDLVGGYYAMIDNPPTSPGGGDAYWSASPPGSSRYVATFKPGYGMGDAYGGTNMYLPPSSPGPWSGELRGAVAASTAATVKSFDETITALGGVICWGSSGGIPPNGSGITVRYLPIGMYEDGLIVSASDSRTSSATVNWSAGYVPASIPAVGSLRGFDLFAGAAVILTRRTQSPVTITASGAVATIGAGVLSPAATSRRIEVSGANEPEYNGVFDAYLNANPLASSATGALYYDMTGTPAASPATGSVTVKYF